MSFKPRFLSVLVAGAAAFTLVAACANDSATDAEAPTQNVSATGQADSPTDELATQPTDQADANDAADPGVPTGPTDPTDAPAALFPVTITADNGDVTIPAQPAHIVALSATATEMLYAIGAGDAVVAVDMFSDYPDGLPEARVDAYQLSVEALTEFDPDLVIGSYISPEQLDQFDSIGMTVIVADTPADMDGAYEQLMYLGAATGHPAEAEALIQSMQAEITDIAARMPQPDPPLSYYYELDQTYYSVTSDTFFGGLLRDLGMVSIADSAQGAAAAGGYPQLSSEFILDADPDYILLADTICCEQNAATVAERDGWGTLSAVTNGRVIELDDNVASRWAPRVVDLLAQIVDSVSATVNH